MRSRMDGLERKRVEALLSAELAKPYQEMDADFMKECSDFLLQLDGYHAALSQEEISNQVKAVLSAHRKRIFRRITLLACLAAAIFTLNWMALK